jgi:hypothetical protein
VGGSTSAGRSPADTEADARLALSRDVLPGFRPLDGPVTPLIGQRVVGLPLRISPI